MQLEKIHSVPDEWELRANKVLSHFKYTHPNEIDIQAICWRYGICIKPLDHLFLDHVVDEKSIYYLKALSFPKEKGRRGTIYLKPGMDAIEKKLLLAEEFCHLYSHYHSQMDISEYELAKTENQAKRMAAYLLMPKRFLEGAYNAAIDEHVLVSEIADFFMVTEEFAHYRMKLAYNRKIDAFMSKRKIRNL